MLLHRLQQRRLGSRAGAVDLIGHQELAEDRTFDEAEAAAAVRLLLQYLRPQDVRRHQVRRALNAPVLQAEGGAQGFHQAGLRQTRHPDQQDMAAGQQRDQGLVDHGLLPEDDVPDRRPQRSQLGADAIHLGSHIRIL